MIPGWISAVFSAPKVIDTATNLVDMAASGIDKAFFTEEERQDFAAAALKQWNDTQVILREESSVRSITRRIIAVLTDTSFFLLIFFAAVVWRFDSEWAEFIFEIGEKIFPLVLGVNAFYFGKYLMDSYVDKKK